jgi:hypothetical protein
MRQIDDMVWLDEIDEYVTIQEYKEYVKYLQTKYNH